VEKIGDARSVLIDIPIGLLSQGPTGRHCDTSARKLLGAKRASSVFPTPSRQALDASNYQEALQINRESTGRGLSQQAWAIVPKIRDIDSLLQSHKELRGLLRECHPELCFWSLNNQTAMQFNKKKEEGKSERLAVLEKYFPQCHELYEQASSEFLRKQVAHDDIIDAMVCAVTAKLGFGGYLTVPLSPEKDRTGLAMEMVYWDGNGKHATQNDRDNHISQADCAFCYLIQNNSERVIRENEFAFVIRDGYPISEGHTLIIPKRHVDSFFSITREERDGLFELVEEAKQALDKIYGPDAYNIGVNDGASAGQTVPHLHIHLIARYDGDVEDPRGGVRWIMSDKAKYWD
jgi:predicted RNase H-like nuclease/diadenosine tetraphosphate (Ap4A) HIT family hydrolase